MNAPAQPLTKNALVAGGMDALDRERVGQVQVSNIAGGVSFATALEVMEFAKLMAISQTAVPKHLRGNPGQCLAVTFQAVEWRMSPFAVANKSYEVNDRIAYESQLLHAVVEARASLRERLNCSYTGEGPTRQCTVTGHFIGDSEPRTYTTPMLKDIKVQNSPLWKNDPDQQLFYYGSRSWARKWAPDVLLGIYTKDELAESPELGREDDPPAANLAERLTGGSSTSGEGHQGGKHIEGELANIGAGVRTEIKPADPVKTEATPATSEKATTDKKKPAGRTKWSRKKASADQTPEPEQQTETTTEATEPAKEPPKEPTTPQEYIAYASRWIAAEGDRDNAWARWDGEDDLRLKLAVSIAARNKLRGQIDAKFGEA